MKEWREYHCEFGDYWEILAESEQTEQESDLLCIHGHDAVMAKKSKPSEYISVNILPKTREFDSITHKIGFKDQYYIQVESLLSGWKAITNESYTKDEVFNLAKLFLGLTEQQAKKIWNMKKLGANSNRIDF